MKILFESKAGKKVEKTFNTLTEAKTFVLKNKKVIKEAQIMEGPLGSGGWTPKKAYNNFKKGYERFNNLQKMDKTKDSFGQNIFDYLTAIVGNVGKDMKMTNIFGVGRDEKGYYIFADDYIFSDGNAFRKFKDDEYENQERVVSPYSEKYKNKIYMPKLTKYIENHESLPSHNQVYNYMKALIEKRYENNLNALKKKQPTSLTAKNDVENF